MAIEEQNSLGRGASGKNLPECSKQNIFKKWSSLKFFLFFIGLVWRKVFIFRFARIFSKFSGYVPDFGELPSGAGMVAPLPPSPTLMYRRYQISCFTSIVCSYSGMKPQSWPILGSWPIQCRKNVIVYG